MKKLKELRKANNFSYQNMADLLNVSKAYYWQIENKKRRLSYDMAIKISKVFMLKPDDIFFNEFH